jgi:hypothetical protein
MKFIKFDRFILNAEDIIFVRLDDELGIEIQVKSNQGPKQFILKFHSEFSRERTFEALSFDTNSFVMDDNKIVSTVTNEIIRIRNEHYRHNASFNELNKEIKTLNKLLRKNKVIPTNPS